MAGSRSLNPPSMPRIDAARRNHPLLLSLMFALGLGGIYVLLVAAFFPFARLFEFDSDEGINLMQSLLHHRGYRFYADIWMDQPPLFKWMLEGWLSLTEWSVPSGRWFVLLHGGALISAMYLLVRTHWSRVAAFGAALLLATSRQYLVLSVSVMQAAPTMLYLVLAVVGLARYHRTRRATWAVFCGIMLGISFCCKPLSIPLLPVFAIAMILVSGRASAPSGRRIHRYRPTLWAVIAFVAVLAVVMLTAVPVRYVGWLFKSIFESHVPAALKVRLHQNQMLGSMLSADWDIFLLSIIGSVYLLRKRAWFSSIAIVWAALAVVSLCLHRPLWYHHYQILAVPMCWLAGVAIEPLVETVSRWRAKQRMRTGRVEPLLTLSVTIALVLVLARTPARLAREREQLDDQDAFTPKARRLLDRIEAYAPRADWLVTDAQMYAFRAKLPVPPELACASLKRALLAPVTNAAMLRILDTYKPQLILDTGRQRLPMTPQVQAAIDAQFAIVYEDEYGNRLFVRRDLLSQPGSPALSP